MNLIFSQILFFFTETCVAAFMRREFSFSPFLLQDILNHILRDIEIFMGHISAVVAKNSKTKKKKLKGEPENESSYWKSAGS